MAFIGLKYVVGASLTETAASGSTAASATYADGFVIGKAVTANLNITANDATVYGDDAVAEMDTGFAEGTLDIGLVHMVDDIQTKVLGHTVTNGVVSSKVDDVAPYLGLGFYAPKTLNGARKYRAIWLTKAIASEPSEEFQTRQGQTSFQTPSIPFHFMPCITGVWKQEQTFDTEAETVTWLNGLAGIS